MPTKTYSLESNLGSLEVISNAWSTKFEVKLNGQSLGQFNNKEVRQGKEILLPDGSILKIKLVMVLLTYELQLSRNGQALAGSATDPREQIKQAMYITYFVGGLTLVISLIALASKGGLLTDAGFGIGSGVEGAIFLVLGYFISKNKVWAAVAATALLTADTILLIVNSAQSEGHTNIGGLLVKIFFIIYLYKGYQGIKTLNSQKIAVVQV